jgi:TonB family protein
MLFEVPIDATARRATPVTGGSALAAPAFNYELEPWRRTFARNLLDFVFGRDARAARPLRATAPFWPDVFVADDFPARRFAESLLLHAGAAALVYIAIILPAPHLTRARAFQHASIQYYSVSEYLPELKLPAPDTPARRATPQSRPKHGEPRLGRQEIISLPPRPDNFRQTIVDAAHPEVLRDDKPLPNLVAGITAPPVPAAAATRRIDQLVAPALPRDVVAPAPGATVRDLAKLGVADAARDIVAPPAAAGAHDVARLNLPAPAGDVVAPATKDTGSSLARLRVGVATSEVVGPAPHAGAPRALNAAQLPAAAPEVVAPAPSANAASGSTRLLALSLDPAAVHGPIELPGGSRAGEFAVSPNGRADAPGTPDIKLNAVGGATSSASSDGNGSGGNNGGAAPGITIAAGPHAATNAGGATVAAATLPASVPRAALPRNVFASIPRTVGDIARQTAPNRPQPEVEDEVFGPRKYYSMTLNMPNLGSMGGTCIIRFAEMKESTAGELTAPVATSKVDPAYPAELLREHFDGTVTLYAVIGADGQVSEVRVLHGVEPRLDESARVALAKWRFAPARKNGAAVALEAVVQIPFRSRRISF